MFCTNCGKETEGTNELCSTCLPVKKNKSLLPLVVILALTATASVASTVWLHVINDDLKPSSYGSYFQGDIIKNADGIYEFETTEHDLVITLVDNGKNLLDSNDKELDTEDLDDYFDTSNSKDFVFADSNTRYLTRDEVIEISDTDLRIARNEIYARHGRKFNDETLQTYFNSKSWYTAKYSATEFDALGNSLFNNYEITNLELLSSFN